MKTISLLIDGVEHRVIEDSFEVSLITDSEVCESICSLRNECIRCSECLAGLLMCCVGDEDKGSFCFEKVCRKSL